MHKMLPVEMDRKSWVKLPHQVADALRRAIADGMWVPGERLPSTRDVASELGVSRRVATDAMRILAKEGRVSLREKSSAVVNVEESLVKNHKILLLRQGSASYSDAEERIRMRLSDAGYFVSTISLPRVGAHSRYDIARLRADLRHPYELVVCPPTKPHVMNIVKASRQPFVTVFCDAVNAPGLVGAVPLLPDVAEDGFVRHCVRRRVKSVAVVGKWRGDGAGVLSGLAAAGLAAESWIVPAKVCVYRKEAVERAAFHAFSRRLAGGHACLPEVLYFTDDYLCYGAMTAMEPGEWVSAELIDPSGRVVDRCEKRSAGVILVGKRAKDAPSEIWRLHVTKFIDDCLVRLGAATSGVYAHEKDLLLVCE